MTQLYLLDMLSLSIFSLSLKNNFYLVCKLIYDLIKNKNIHTEKNQQKIWMNVCCDHFYFSSFSRMIKNFVIFLGYWHDSAICRKLWKMFMTYLRHNLIYTTHRAHNVICKRHFHGKWCIIMKNIKREMSWYVLNVDI